VEPSRCASAHLVQLHEAFDRSVDERTHPARAPELLLERLACDDQGRDIGLRADACDAARAGEEADLADHATGPHHTDDLGASPDGTEDLARSPRDDVRPATDITLA